MKSLGIAEDGRDFHVQVRPPQEAGRGSERSAARLQRIDLSNVRPSLYAVDYFGRNRLGRQHHLVCATQSSAHSRSKSGFGSAEAMTTSIGSPFDSVSEPRRAKLAAAGECGGARHDTALNFDRFRGFDSAVASRHRRRRRMFQCRPAPVASKLATNSWRP